MSAQFIDEMVKSMPLYKSFTFLADFCLKLDLTAKLTE